jgi:hypothetical protein
LKELFNFSAVMFQYAAMKLLRDDDMQINIIVDQIVDYLHDIRVKDRSDHVGRYRVIAI